MCLQEQPFHKDENEVPFKLHNEEQKESELKFIDIFQKDIQELQLDYEYGKKQLCPPKKISFEKAKRLAEEVTAEQIAVSQKKQKVLKELLESVNRQNCDDIARLTKLTAIGSGVDKMVDLEDCFNAVLTGKRSSIQDLNQTLLIKDIDTIATLTVLVGDYITYEGQLKRIKENVKAILHAYDQNDIEESLMPTLSSKLEVELSARYYFDDFNPEEQLVLRLFTAKSGMIPFRKQCDLIRLVLQQQSKGPQEIRDLVFQLIMGGGKSSVIATIVLYLLARKEGRIATIVVPPALFKAVSENLNRSLIKSFNQPLAALNLERSDFTHQKIKKLNRLLTQLKNTPQPLLITAPTIQGLELEKLSLCLKISRLLKEQQNIEGKNENFSSSSKEEKINLKKEIKKLGECCFLIESVLEKFIDSSDAIFDEVDLLLDSFKEVVFVNNEEISIEKEYLTIQRMLFEALVSEDLLLLTLPNSPSLKTFMKIPQGEQQRVSLEDYYKHIVSLLAKYIFVNHPPMQQHLCGQIDGFVRYVTGKIHPDLENWRVKKIEINEPEAEKHFPGIPLKQLRDDLSFLYHLESLYHEKSTTEAANRIAFVKHQLIDLLNVCLSKSFGIHYGVSPYAHHDKKIIPYNGINSPARTEFGYHWEHSMYEFLKGFMIPPDPSVILSIAESWIQVANREIGETGTSIEYTPEYQEFLELFGVPIDKVTQPGNLEKAGRHVSSHTSILLDLQEILIEKCVSYTKERLSSNGFDLVELFSSRTGMSGTPWNVLGYSRSLAKNYHPDKGTEGKVIHQILKRTKQVIEIDLLTEGKQQFSLSQFFVTCYEEANDPKLITGLIEAGGLLKRFGGNRSVAEEWGKFLMSRQHVESEIPFEERSVNPRIEAVLYFDRDEGSYDPDTLYAWSFNRGVIKIGGTSAAALESKGLSPENYVVYYDQRHTTGFDIQQRHNAQNLITLDSMTLRTLVQSAMRVRGLILEASLLFVVDRMFKKSLHPRGDHPIDYIIGSSKKQTFLKIESIMRHIPHYITHMTRKPSVEAVTQLVRKKQFDSDFVHLVDKMAPFFVSTYQEEHYLQHGYLKANKNTRKALNNRLECNVSRFNKALSETCVEKNVEIDHQTAELKRWISSNPGIPNTWPLSDERTGIQQEVEQCVEIRTEVNVKVEIEEELEIALRKFNAKPVHEVRSIKEMTLNEFKNIVSALQSQKPQSMQLLSLNERLKAYEYTVGKQILDFSIIFEEPLFGTDAYFYPSSDRETLPVFHRLHRPAKQVLITKTPEGKLHFLFLSEREAGRAKLHLEYLSQKGAKDFQDCWLIQPDGIALAKSIAPFPTEDLSVRRALIEINGFCGNIDFLNKKEYEKEFEEWLQKDSALKVIFLKLKALSSPLQKKALETSSAIAAVTGTGFNKKSGVGLTCKRREEREKGLSIGFIPKTPLEAKLLTDPNKLHNLNYSFIRFLTIDPNKDDPLNQKALLKIGNENVPEHNRKQLLHISDEHVRYLSTKQIPFLPPERVKALSDSKQLVTYKLNSKQEIEECYLLDINQLQGLEEHQKDLLSSINPEFYPYLNKPWQIASLPPSRLGCIDPMMIPFIIEEQINRIDPSIFSKEFLLQLTPDQVRSIPAGMLKTVAPVVGDIISKKQIHSINDEEQIQNLENIAKTFEGEKKIPIGLWTSWISPEMVCHITKKQTPHLFSKEQIVFCPTSHLEYLTPNQLSLIGAQSEISEIVRFYKEVSLDPYANERCWVDSYLSVKEKKWNKEILFFDTVKNCGYGVNKLSTSEKRVLLEKANALQKVLSVTEFFEKITQCLDTLSIHSQGFCSAEDYMAIENESSLNLNEIISKIKSEKENILGEKRFRLSQLALAIFSTNKLEVNSSFKISENTDDYNKKSVAIISLSGAVFGGLVGLVSGPIGWGVLGGAALAGGVGVTAAIGDHYSYKNVYSRLADTIRSTINSLSVRSIEHFTSPSDLPKWPYSEYSTELIVKVACDYFENFDIKVSQTMFENNSSREYIVVERKNMCSRKIMGYVLRTMVSSRKAEMKIEWDDSSLLTLNDAKQIPTLSVQNSSSREIN
ncbi:MAG: DUF3638 domain-containing protein, partial [Chlamydiota bacterium]